jgi:hypothetical protein
MDRDVVEVAQAILHAFQPREELLPTLQRLLAREKAGEELRCVSHFLSLNAQLVTAAGIEPSRWTRAKSTPETPRSRYARSRLELKRGHEAELFEVARELTHAVAAQLALKSKSERGYELLEGSEAAHIKAAPIDLSR